MTQKKSPSDLALREIMLSFTNMLVTFRRNYGPTLSEDYYDKLDHALHALCEKWESE